MALPELGNRDYQQLYIRKERIDQFHGILDRISINELGIRYKLEDEVKWFRKYFAIQTLL